MKLSTVVPALKALDWARIAAYALVFVVWTGAVYMKGRDDEQDKQHEVAMEQIQDTVDQVIEWSGRAGEIERETAEQNARLEQGGKRYEESVDKNPRPASCDLTDDELRDFQKLVEG